MEISAINIEQNEKMGSHCLLHDFGCLAYLKQKKNQRRFKLFVVSLKRLGNLDILRKQFMKKKFCFCAITPLQNLCMLVLNLQSKYEKIVFLNFAIGVCLEIHQRFGSIRYNFIRIMRDIYHIYNYICITYHVLFEHLCLVYFSYILKIFIFLYARQPRIIFNSDNYLILIFSL